MMMAPLSSTSPAPQAAPSGQSVASAAARVAPVAQSSALAGLVAGASTGGTGVPTTAQPQQISAQALLTLIQTLGKPLSGTVGQPAPVSGGSGGRLVVAVVHSQVCRLPWHCRKAPQDHRQVRCRRACLCPPEPLRRHREHRFLFRLKVKRTRHV
jgi:hypothetical protein